MNIRIGKDQLVGFSVVNMAPVWVVDSNCFIHIASMAPEGFIDDLKKKIELYQERKWLNNRTRSAIVEFSVYNAQVNIFATVTCVAEFIGGGVVPWYRIESIR